MTLMTDFNEKQIEILLNKSKELDCEWYPHWATAIYTGMRNGELYALTWDKVNLDDRKILVDCSWNNTDGFKSTKSGDDRMVEIAPPLIPVLSELKLKHADSNFVQSLPGQRFNQGSKGPPISCRFFSSSVFCIISTCK